MWFIQRERESTVSTNKPGSKRVNRYQYCCDSTATRDRNSNNNKRWHCGLVNRNSIPLSVERRFSRRYVASTFFESFAAWNSFGPKCRFLRNVTRENSIRSLKSRDYTHIHTYTQMDRTRTCASQPAFRPTFRASDSALMRNRHHRNHRSQCQCSNFYSRENV